MKIEAFKLLRDMENSWWYQGRKAIAKKNISKFVEGGQNILDFGAGYGGMLETLRPYGEVNAFEISEEAKNECIKRGYRKTFSSVEEALSKENCHTLITLFDVLEHVEEDSDLVESLYQALAPDGYVVITVPAFQYLWGVHDIEHNHFRRYTKGQIVNLLRKHRFKVKYASYWNTILFIPAAITRILGFSGKSSLNSPGWLNLFFLNIVRLESFFMPLVSLPFGTGIIIIAKKDDSLST